MNDTESNRWDVPRFERWLRVGVESFVLEDAGSSAFPEAAADLLNGGSLAQGMANFVQELDAGHRDNFKQALAQVLTSLEPQDEYVPVANALLEIAIATRAYPVLHVLSGKIGRGFFGQHDPTARTNLFSMTLYAVARLGDQGREDALRCMHLLIESPNFQAAYAGVALLALCQIEPEALDRHLDAPGLRRRLQEQFAQFDTDGSLRLRLALQVFERIQLTNLEEALPRLQFGDPNNPGRRADDWLMDALIHGPDSPLTLEGGFLRKKNDPYVAVWIDNLEAVPTQIWLPPHTPSQNDSDWQNVEDDESDPLFAPLHHRRGQGALAVGSGS